MTLKDRLEQDYKQAFKAGQHEVVATLRLIKAQVKNAEIARRKDFDDHEVLEVIFQAAKRHQDAIEQFQKGGRADLVQHEQVQLSVVERYLPAKLSEAELRDIVQELIAAVGAMGPQDLGKVMGQVMAKVRGQADGAKVRTIVTQELNRKST